MINTNKGIISWFARNAVAANLLMIIIFIAGIASVLTIKKQLFPDLQFNILNINIAYLGAAPQEVETGIIEKVEEVLEDVNGIKKLTSTATEGMASITIEVLNDFDPQEVLDEVKMRVDSISSFPDLSEKPTIYRQRLQSTVIWLSIHGDLNERGLKLLATDIRDDLKAIEGITKVTMVGARDYEMAIEVPEHRLKEYGLTFEQIVAAVRHSSIDLPGGSIKSEHGNILLRTKGQAYSGREFAQLVLLTQPDGTQLRLKDVAQIHDGFTEIENFALFDSKQSISLRVDAIGNDNALVISQKVKDYVDKRKLSLPDAVDVDYWGDSSFYLKGRLDLMNKNMVMGALLVLLILALFLEFKVAFWVMVGIPVCFLGAIALMPLPLFGVSINMISLFAFILVLGIVVDDAIVMGESAYSEIEHNGMSVDSVITGVKRVAMPATFGVLTTIAAFVPMVMVDGMMGAIFESIGWVVILCLVFSLIESKLILPAHLAKMKVKARRQRADGKLPTSLRIRDAVNRKLQHFVAHYYRPLLQRAIGWRYFTLSVFVSMFILTVGLLASGTLRFVFFPNVPSDFISVNVDMVEGSSAQATNTAVSLLEQGIVKVEAQYFIDHGIHVVKHRSAFNNGPAAGQVFIELSKGEEREIDGLEIVNLWRAQVGEIAGVKNIKFNATTGGGGGADIAFQLKSQSSQQLNDAAQALKRVLGEYEGVFDVQDSQRGGNDEIVLNIKPEAQMLGITLADLARQVRYGFYGAEAQRLQRDGEEVKVMVRYPASERHSLGNLENMRIRTPGGDEVPFSSVAEFVNQPSFTAITRVNGERSVTVTGSVDKAIVSPGQVVKDIRGDDLIALLERYPQVEAALEGASKDEADSMADLVKAFVFSLLAIYALMAVPLKSYTQPLIIMSVIPFGFIGAMMGHMLLGLSVSVLSLFGIIALAGVVVNDSLIMVDFVNRAVAGGASVKDAAIEAGTKRFRAIILTSLTTFFGLMPIVMEPSLQAKIVVPMAVSLAFGILFATVITLILIPCLYVILQDIKGVFRRAPKRVELDLDVEKLS